jgi:hypothetical protein
MRLTTGVLVWVVAAAAATAVGLAAVAAIGTDIFGGGQDPLTQSQVNDLLASPAPTPPPTTSLPSSTTQPPPTTPPAAQPHDIVTAGGTVTARCTPTGLVEVLSTAPAQGYSVDSGRSGGDDHPSVKFRSGEHEIEIRLRCVNGLPSPEIEEDD